jgi:hypothetical protein
MIRLQCRYSHARDGAGRVSLPASYGSHVHVTEEGGLLGGTESVHKAFKPIHPIIATVRNCTKKRFQ